MERADFVPMSNETRGKALRERMVALGLDESKLSRATGKDRGTIRRAFDGTASTITYEQLEMWFDREEHKVGQGVEVVPAIGAPGDDPAKHVMIRIEEGGTVVVDGPPESMDALIAAATALMREMKHRASLTDQ